MNVGIVQMVGSRSHSHQFVVLLLIMGREMDLSPERFPSFSHGEVFCPFSLSVCRRLTPKSPSSQTSPLKWWPHLWTDPYLKKTTLVFQTWHISIHLTSSTMRLIHLMSFLDWIWVSHRGEDKLQRRRPVPQGLLLQPEKLSIQFSIWDLLLLITKQEIKDFFTFKNKTRTLRLYRPPPSSPDQTVLCRGSQIQYDSSEHKIFITTTFLCQGLRVLPIVRAINVVSGNTSIVRR